jgi:hypothetical protein
MGSVEVLWVGRICYGFGGSFYGSVVFVMGRSKFLWVGRSFYGSVEVLWVGRICHGSGVFVMGRSKLLWIGRSFYGSVVVFMGRS